MNQRGVVV